MGVSRCTPLFDSAINCIASIKQIYRNKVYLTIYNVFRSPKLKAQVNFPDHILSVVRLSV